jgi:dihydrofolate reductase
MRVSAIVAGVPLNDNLGIGADGGIPWRVPEDMHWFRDHTIGKTVIMGRKTWESLPAHMRPLPDRENIVITRTHATEYPPNVHICQSVENALECATHIDRDVVVIGGAQIYTAFIPYYDAVYVTYIGPYESIYANCDTILSLGFLNAHFKESTDSNIRSSRSPGYTYQFCTYNRIPKLEKIEL